jgi:hypothetical protein
LSLKWHAASIHLYYIFDFNLDAHYCFTYITSNYLYFLLFADGGNAMARYEFRVQEYPVPQTHYVGWEAKDQANGKSVLLPNGGTGQYLGRYPEIEDYVSTEYSKSVSLRYGGQPAGDDLSIGSDGNSIWTFRRNGDEFIVRDIPRIILRIMRP